MSVRDALVGLWAEERGLRFWRLAYAIVLVAWLTTSCQHAATMRRIDRALSVIVLELRGQP